MQYVKGHEIVKALEQAKDPSPFDEKTIAETKSN
jgi:hypothetical protein